MKKIAALFLFCVLALSLSACNSSSNNGVPPSETGSAGSTANFDEAGLESEDEAEDLVGDWTLELRFPDDAHDPLILRCHVETEDSVVLYLDDGTELTLSYGAETTSPLAGEGECLWIANEDGSLYYTGAYSYDRASRYFGFFTEEYTDDGHILLPDTAVLDIEYPLACYTFDQTTRDGYVLKKTLKIGPWIRANDLETLEAAWKSVGGTRSTPTAEDFRDYVFDDAFRDDRSVIAFGTMYMENLTEGFDITAEYPLSEYIIFHKHTEMQDPLGVWSGIIDLSNERKVLGRTSGKTDLNEVYCYAKMVRSTWGEVPIAIAVSNVYNPKYPDGNPLLLEKKFSFGGTSFCIPMFSPNDTEHTDGDSAA